MDETNQIILCVIGSIMAGLLGYAVKGVYGVVMGFIVYCLVLGLFKLFLHQRGEG